MLNPRADRANREPVVTVVVVPRVDVVRVEVEIPRVVRVVLVERTRPVVAVVAHVVEICIPAVARGREENRNATAVRLILMQGEASVMGLHAFTLFRGSAMMRKSLQDCL